MDSILYTNVNSKMEKMLLGGDWVESVESIEVLNPQDKSVIARVP